MRRDDALTRSPGPSSRTTAPPSCRRGRGFVTPRATSTSTTSPRARWSEQQPFGGGRASGTNDKAGSAFNLLRWTSPRIIKENFAPPTQLAYPFMGDE